MAYKQSRVRRFYPDYAALIGILENQQAAQEHSQRLESRLERIIAQCVFILGLIGIIATALTA